MVLIENALNVYLEYFLINENMICHEKTNYYIQVSQHTVQLQ